MVVWDFSLDKICFFGLPSKHTEKPPRERTEPQVRTREKAERGAKKERENSVTEKRGGATGRNREKVGERGPQREGGKMSHIHREKEERDCCTFNSGCN